MPAGTESGNWNAQHIDFPFKRPGKHLFFEVARQIVDSGFYISIITEVDLHMRSSRGAWDGLFTLIRHSLHWCTWCPSLQNGGVKLQNH